MGKDKLHSYEKSGIIYEIDCKDCEMTYIGQSKRKLLLRTKEHIRDVKKQNKKSALASHSLEKKHKINFDNVKIVE